MATQTEVPGVNNAVSKLEELGSRMRSEDFGFQSSDVSNIDRVIEALHELEQERKKLHDELETETIKASVNRHKLQFLPAQIKDEIMVAVNSARQSNAKAQQELQDKLDNINKNIIELGLTHQELEQENSILHPERELIRQQHEEIISQLNQRMAEKASMQIALNETRDKVRQANQSIVNLEDGILQLKEDLIQERTEARHEKKRLKKAVADTAEKTRDQREQNMGKKKELDSVQEVLTDSEGKLDALRKSIRRFETSRSRKEEEERNLNAKLTKELKMINQQKEKGEIIMKETKKEKKDFAMREDDLLFKIDRFEKDIKEQEELVQDLEIQKSSIQADVRDRLGKKEDDAARVAALDARLQLAKKNLTQKAEEVGRMQAENIDMTEEIETIGESHKAVVAQLNKQLEECREQLNIERKERVDMQGRKDSVTKDLEDHKTDQQRFMQSVNTRIQEGKTKHVELSNEGVQIQKDLRKEEEEIRKLQGELTQVEKEYEEMFTTMNTKTQTMESDCGMTDESSIASSPDQGEIVSMETDLSTKTQDVEVKTPVFQDLEVTFEERTETYDKMKKDVVVLKNKKITLEDAIVKSKRDKEALLPIQAKLREDLKQMRGESLKQMKELGTVMEDTEQQIFQEGSKLKTVMEENQRFQESCRKLEADILDIQEQMEHNEKLTTKLQQDLVKSKDDLVKSWESDRVMQEFFATRDEETVEAFGRLLNKTEKRETTISDVTGRLMGELQTLAQFLDNVSSRRPRDTRSGKRPPRSGRRPVTTSSRGHSAVDAIAAANPSAGTPRLPNLDLNPQSRQSSRAMSSRPATVGSKGAESLNDTSRDKSVVTVTARS